jgi:hypothetical protein
MLSSSQLRGEDLSRAVLYISATTEQTVSQTCHADHHNASRQDPSQTRQSTAAFPAAQTAMGTLRAPCLPEAGEPRIASTSNEGLVQEGAVGWEGAVAL